MAISPRFAGSLLTVLVLAFQAAPGLAAQQPGTPKKITHVDPVYPEQARQARVQGIVMVQITIGTDGRVSDARVIRSIPLLDAAALAAVRQWVYEPVKAPATLTVTVPFGVASPAAVAAAPLGTPAPPQASPPRAQSPGAVDEGIIRVGVSVIIKKLLGHDLYEIKPSSRLIEDLGAHADDLFELILALEEEFNIEISADEGEGFGCVAGTAKSLCLSTVDDVRKFVVTKVAAKQRKP